MAANASSAITSGRVVSLTSAVTAEARSKAIDSSGTSVWTCAVKASTSTPGFNWTIAPQ